MVKALFTLFLLIEIGVSDPFRTHCIPCHKEQKVSLKKIFFDYLLYFSSERKVKASIKEFLLHPSPKKQIYKEKKLFKHSLPLEVIEPAIDIYWELYKVIGKIK